MSHKPDRFCENIPFELQERANFLLERGLDFGKVAETQWVMAAEGLVGSGRVCPGREEPEAFEPFVSIQRLVGGSTKQAGSVFPTSLAEGAVQKPAQHHAAEWAASLPRGVFVKQGGTSGTGFLDWHIMDCTDRLVGDVGGLLIEKEANQFRGTESPECHHCGEAN